MAASVRRYKLVREQNGSSLYVPIVWKRRWMVVKVMGKSNPLSIRIYRSIPVSRDQ